MKKLFITSAIVLAVVSSQAAVVRWVGSAVGGTGNYTDGNSWSADMVNVYGSAPLATDSHGLIGTWGGTLMPTIDSAITEVPDTIGISWDTSFGELNIVNGGSINANTVYMGFEGSGNASDGVLNVSGGNMVISTLYIGAGTVGTGTINQSGGILHLGAVNYARGVVNLSDDAFFLINGDYTGANLVGQGIISASVAGQEIVEFYNTEFGRTEWTVIPEPATFGLMALLGGGMLFIRRRLTL
ncbi:MAG: hypothetical protein DRP64_11775 [Verrucomicrobia bacterium]|nr:MAG: hypothetical protein DRP64_11775 [Verrucomicrobiota bacterium]